MSISSDIDHTETLEEFVQINKFINTDEMTDMGKGVGLEIGNSFFFYEHPNGAISYFQGGPGDRRTIINYLKAGYIDFLHSYGKKPDFTRNDAITALHELKKHDIKLDVWIDHTKSIDNLGNDVTFGLGDHRDSTAYHSDLTIKYGIKFIWSGRLTMITGQTVPITLKSFTSIFDADHPYSSSVNLSKEFAKSVLAVLGNKKYAIHRNNDLVRITALDDGQKVYEFTRFDNFYKGVGTGANSKGLAYVISNTTLNRLKRNGGYMIVYTHLGHNADCLHYICEETQNALRNLAREFRAGHIYITKTSKLLNYYINHKYLDWSYEAKDGAIDINILYVKDPVFGSFVPTIEDLQGITFYVPDASRANIYLRGRKMTNIQGNPPDFRGRQSLTIGKKHYEKKGLE